MQIPFSCRLELGREEVISSWKMQIQHLLLQRWSYRLSAQERPFEAIVFKTPWSAMGFFGVRPSCAPDASTRTIASVLGIEETEVHNLWKFAEDLARMTKEKSAPAPEHYLLAAPRRLDLCSIALACAFKMEPVARPSNMRALVNSQEGDPCWLVDERENSRLDDIGVICITDPAVVLVVIHSRSSTLEQLAYELAGQGIPFLMPRPITHAKKISKPQTTMYHRKQEVVGQERPANYVFTAHDFLSYRSSLRNIILEDARISRLVLMMGGCPWRMALPFCDIAMVVDGPSSHAASLDPDLTLRFEHRRATLVEDRLLDSEMRMLIGEARVASGLNEAHVSFLPSNKAWFNSSYGHVGWSEVSEDFFVNLNASYERIVHGDLAMRLLAQPLTGRRWPDKLGNFFNTRRIMALVRQDAVSFLSEL